MNYPVKIIFSVLLIIILGAILTQPQYTVTISVSGQGLVSKSPSQESYSSRSIIQLTAVPVNGWVFAGWSGDLTGSVNPATITVNGNKAVTATFTQIQCNLTIQSPSGSGSTNPTTGIYSYNQGENIQVIATQSSEWKFDHWILDDSTTSYNNPINLKMDSSHRLKAVFTILQYNLTINVSGDGTTSPSAGTYVFDSGSQVKITATPQPGFTFTGWSGALSDSANLTTITMDSAKSLTATFTRFVYHGVSASDIYGWNGQSTVNVRSSIQRFVELTGKSVYIYNTWLAEFESWNKVGPVPFDWLLKPGDHSVLPLLQEGLIKAVSCFWGPYTNEYDGGQTLKDIANGKYDAYITAQAVTCKDFGYPIYMRLGAEFDICQGAGAGDWTWASNPTDFVNAWRRIVGIFRAQGASNVLWVWNPNFSDFDAPHHQDEYYPGDSYVDWVGIDMYQTYDEQDPNAQMSHICKQYANKTIMIGEWGSNSFEWTGTTTSDAKQAEYMTKFFDAVEARTNIKMICYFYTSQFMFDPSSAPLTTTVYRNRIANPLYPSK